MSNHAEPFEHCLNFSAGLLARAMNRIAEEEFGNVGLTPTQAYLLMQVAERPGIPLKRVSEALGIDASTLSRLIDKMQAKGWMVRGVDGRSAMLRLTDRGREKLPDVRRAWAGLEARYVSILGEDHARVIHQLSLATGRKLSASIT